MMNENNKMLHINDCKCLAWYPIFAGALVAVGLTFLLNLFSIAIGLTAYTTDSSGVQSLALGGLIGTAIGTVAAMFASGWLAGYLGIRHCNKRHLGALYGFLAWCVALIIAIILVGHSQEYVTYYSGFLSGPNMHAMPVGAGAPMQNVAAAASQQPAASIVISSYIIFFLFFLSAFASSLGGHCGMSHVCKDEVVVNR